MLKHTPLPWELHGLYDIGRGETKCIADCEYLATQEEQANTLFIIKACNLHYELVEALYTIANSGVTQEPYAMELAKEALIKAGRIES